MKAIRDRYNNIFVDAEDVNYNQTSIQGIKYKGVYELGLYNFMEKYLSKLDVDFYDIGASEGIFSIVFSHFNKKNNVYAFEPSTKSYNIMLKNIKLNNRTNIVPYNIALGEETKELFVHVNDNDCAISLQDNNEYTDHQLIKMDVLKNYDNNATRFLKLDIEQYEYDCLKNEIDFLKSDYTIGVCSEFIGDSDYKRKLYNLLSGCFDYCYVIDKNLSILDENVYKWKDEYFNNKQAMNVVFLKKEWIKEGEFK